VQNTANTTSNEVEMGGTQETPNLQSEPAENTEQAAAATEDIILVDAQADPEPPTPAKKCAGFKFLE
jgi:hypothetical protein